MASRPSASLPVLLLLLASSASAARGDAPCGTRCEDPELKPNHVVLDANTGELLDGTIRFPQVDNVQVVFKNKNPFKYQYRFTVVTSPLEQATILDFLTKVAGIAIPDGVASLDAAHSQCQTPKVKKFLEAETAAGNAQASAAKVAAPRADALESYNDFLDLTAADKVTCKATCEPAELLRPQLKTLLDQKPLAAAVADLKAKIAAAKALMAAAKTAAEEMPSGTDEQVADRTDCIQQVEQAGTRLAALEEDLATFAELAETTLANQKKFSALAKIIDGLDQSSFTEVRNAITAGVASNVKVGLFKQSLRQDGAAETKTAEVNIQVGDSRITISGGVGFTTLEQVTIKRQTAADPADATKTIEVFAEENSSSFRPDPVLMLNANIGRPFKFLGIDAAPALFSWSLGVIVAGGQTKTETEYVTGPSFGFLENTVVFTVGYHAARVDTLGGGFKIGKPIPAGLQDPLPVNRRWKGALMLGVTYRFR